MLLGKGGSDMSCPAGLTVCFVSIFSHLFLSSNTTLSRPTITSPLRSPCWLLSSSSFVSLTAFLPQRGSVWPSLCLCWRAGRLQRVGHYQSSPATTNTMLLPSCLPGHLLPLTFSTAVITTTICRLPSVCNLCQHKVVDYFQGETKRIPHPNSFPSSIIMRGTRTVIIFITIWRHSWAPAHRQLNVIFLLFLLTFLTSGILIGFQVIFLLQNKQISTTESIRLRCFRLETKVIGLVSRFIFM